MVKRIEYTAGDFIGDEGLIYIEDVEPHVSPSGNKARRAKFLCGCGKEFESHIKSVKRNKTTSCGCVHRELAAERGRAKCGENNSSWRVRGHYLYETWHGMMARCYNENASGYPHYGGRGITVCEWWHDSDVFLEFCDVVLGERPEGYTLDRINNDKGYFPENVRWADKKTQQNNRRNSNGS